MQEDTPEVTEIPQQCRVWNARRLGWTYERIQAEFGLTPRDVSRCLKRTALGLFWESAMRGGSDPYLCGVDEGELVSLLLSHCEGNDCFRTFEVTDLAHTLKTTRHQMAAQHLRSFG